MSPDHRSSPMGRAAVALLCGVTVWELTAPAAFVGQRAQLRAPATQLNGWRFDWMLEKRGDSAELQTSEGFFIGEVGFEKSCNSQGYRYRMRPTPEEYKKGIEVEGLLYQFGPIKIKLGEVFGGTGNNKKLRELKKRIAAEGITDQQKNEENEFWLERYGHKRWFPPYVDQSTGLNTNLLRGVGAWSGFDPLKEEKGKTWIEADYGKPWLKKYIGWNAPTPPEFFEKERESGKLSLPAPKTK